jgi:hypothetical protein
MPPWLPYFAAGYRALLRLYPAKLRLAYGNEMADVFNQVLQTEWRRRGMRGVIAAAFDALTEFFLVAVPGHLSSDWMIVGSLSLAITCGILGSLVAVMMSPPLRLLHP